MRKPKPPPASPDDVEAAFYDALQGGDIDALMACWSDEDEIVCIHPGGARLLGPAAIRSGFEAMFASTAMRAKAVSVHKLQGLGASVHSVIERIEVLGAQGLRHAYVMTTNVYHETAQGWRMVAHHASAGSVHDAQEVLSVPPVLH